MTSGQEKVRLAMAIRIFCHGTDADTEHRKRCLAYLQKRYRAVGEMLLREDDFAALRICTEEGILPEDEKERLLSVAVSLKKPAGVGVLLSAKDADAHELKKTDGMPPYRKLRKNAAYVSESAPCETPKQALYRRVLQLFGRKFDRFYPHLGQILHLLLPADVNGPTTYMGTDGFSLQIGEKAFVEAFAKDHEGCQRDLAHVLVHQLLFHPLQATQLKDSRLWNLCCDMMTEWILEQKIGYLRQLDPRKRHDRTICYRYLAEKRLFSAAELYQHIKMQMESVVYLQQSLCDVQNDIKGQSANKDGTEYLAQLFFCDEHTLWYEKQHTIKEWKAQLKKQQRVVGEGNEEGLHGGIRGSGGHGIKEYKEPEASEYDYQAFLEKFMITGEERVLNQEDFDPIMYHYSRMQYNGPVFLEPLETSEVRRLSELVIAIDTSGSCSGDIVQQFLKETFSILDKKERFFRKMRVHILQCDSMIQEYRLIENEQEWEEYRKTVKIKGFGNTDFRPVFTWIEDKQKSGDIKDLKGLIYFTDGAGIFPREAPAYEVAFVHLNEKLLKGQLPSFIYPVNLHMDREFSNLFDEESSFGYCGGR